MLYSDFPHTIQPSTRHCSWGIWLVLSVFNTNIAVQIVLAKMLSLLQCPQNPMLTPTYGHLCSNGDSLGSLLCLWMPPIHMHIKKGLTCLFLLLLKSLLLYSLQLFKTVRLLIHTLCEQHFCEKRIICESRTVLCTAPKRSWCHKPASKRKERRDCANGLGSFLLLTDGSMDE